eukprot:gnl/TRDRNA2_/TRDRNA2_87199_c0_seq1.p1 gnl/TRDRNA2_/TRDRNA2_87199_c0~~gnl/TRDRNA2_/TRDRNA2_87199_c0_seq1.p1  ORF type:complete len:164 (-),score=35.47 gnl/TRDRNA2_/TRDRNA2_87199_c0_seq1:161-652(-)
MASNVLMAGKGKSRADGQPSASRKLLPSAVALFAFVACNQLLVVSASKGGYTQWVAREARRLQWWSLHSVEDIDLAVLESAAALANATSERHRVLAEEAGIAFMQGTMDFKTAVFANLRAEVVATRARRLAEEAAHKRAHMPGIHARQSSVQAIAVQEKEAEP